MPLITCENVSLSYEGRTVATDINFSVNEGDLLSIVGENGSGKSTLVKCLLGLKSVAGGSIIFQKGFKRNSIGYLPQQNDIQRDFPASVYEVVRAGCLNKNRLPFFTASSRALAEGALDMLGILPLRNHCFSELSGGQQQRVLLARALCAADKMLLLDEPVAGVDPVAAAEMYGIVKELKDAGVTVIMVTHDIKISLELSTHILHMGATPLYFGTAQEYRQSEAYKNIVGGTANE